MSLRLSACLDVGGDAVARFRAYLEENRAFVVRISENSGCGCCVLIHDLEVSEEAAALPRDLAATTDWTSAGRASARFVSIDELLEDWP